MAGVITDQMCSIMVVEDQTEVKIAASLAENNMRVYFHFKGEVQLELILLGFPMDYMSAICFAAL